MVLPANGGAGDGAWLGERATEESVDGALDTVAWYALRDTMRNIPYDRTSLEETAKQLTHPKSGTDGCLRWIEEFNRFGTPCILVRGVPTFAIKIHWWLKHGYKPWLRHMVPLCKTPHCMNIEHYRDETPEENREPELVKGNTSYGPKFTPEQAEDMWVDHMNGMAMPSVAAKYGCMKQTASRAIERHRLVLEGYGIPSGFMMPLEKMKGIWRRYEKGESRGEIARRTGLSYKKIKYAIGMCERNMGVKDLELPDGMLAVSSDTAMDVWDNIHNNDMTLESQIIATGHPRTILSRAVESCMTDLIRSSRPGSYTGLEKKVKAIIPKLGKPLKKGSGKTLGITAAAKRLKMPEKLLRAAIEKWEEPQKRRDHSYPGPDEL